MSENDWLQAFLYCAVVVALVKPLGWYMTRVFEGERTFLSPLLRPIEIGLYRLGGIHEKYDQSWRVYTIAILLFNIVGLSACTRCCDFRNCCRSIRR